MAKLYFRYGAMNCGKSTALIQVAHNYEERGMGVLIIKPGVDTKGDAAVVSRIGVRRAADILSGPKDNLMAAVLNSVKDGRVVDCVLVDEAQFLSPRQVDQLFELAVTHEIPVVAFGLRSDFLTKGFPGSLRLFELAHAMSELKTICRCGKKAILNGRKLGGKFIFKGKQVAIDGKSRTEYESLCGSCYLRHRNAA